MYTHNFPDTVTIFTGTPRSGTTLLGKLATQYLEVGAVNEGPFEFLLSDLVPREARLAHDRFYSSVLRKLAGHEYFMLLYKGNVHIDTVVERLRETISERTLAGIGLGVLRLSAEHLRLPRLGHECPLLINDLNKLLRVFPTCKIVNIVRDPRDTTASVLRMPWGANNAVVAATHWARNMRHVRMIADRIGPERYYEFRYEDLLIKSRDIMTSLMTFVSGEVDDAKLEEFTQTMAVNPKRGNTGKYPRLLTSKQIHDIEACAGEEMMRHGYQPKSPPARVSRTRYALSYLHHRAVQVQRMFTGYLTISGQSKLYLAPEEEVFKKFQSKITSPPAQNQPSSGA